MTKKKIAKKTLSDDQKKLEETVLLFFQHLFHFTNYFMKDDPATNFTVPTRSNKVEGEIPWFQANLMKDLDELDNLKRIALASPRGFTKSTTCSIFLPLKRALCRQSKDILIVSNSEALAIEHMRKIKTNLEENERIVGVFGPQESKKWTETHLILRNGSNIRGCGWGAQIRGFRPDLIIMDDIESDETVDSEDLRNKLREWILKAAINSLTPNGNIIWVGTLIKRVGLLYDFIHNPPESWNPIFLDCYHDHVEGEGHELWPQMWPHSRLQQRRSEIGSWAFASEFRNDPRPSSGNRFNPALMKPYDHFDGTFGEYVAIDPSFSDSPSACYGVIINVLHDSRDNTYIDRYFKQKTTSGELIRYFKKMFKERKQYIRKVGIEANGPQKGFYDRLVEECNLEGLYPPVEILAGRTQSRSKDDRITYGIQPRLEAGKLFYKTYMTDLVDDLGGFPEIKYKDLLDALSSALSICEPGMTYENEQFPQELEEDDDLTVSERGVTGYGDNYAAA